MVVDLYYLPASAPCRSIMMLSKALSVELNLKRTELRPPAQDQLKPEFLKMNPQHCIPTIDDNGFYLWESRAILAYLVNQYGKNDSLYPSDPKKRALVDQRLYFDMGTLYQRYAEYIYPQVFDNKEADPEKLKRLHDGFEFLEKFLEGREYVAGDSITIADYAIVATLSTFEVSNVGLEKFPRIMQYLEKLKKEIDGYDELNEPGVQEFKEYLKPRESA